MTFSHPTIVTWCHVSTGIHIRDSMGHKNGGQRQVFKGQLTVQTRLFFRGYRYSPLTLLKHLRWISGNFFSVTSVVVSIAFSGGICVVPQTFFGALWQRWSLSGSGVQDPDFRTRNGQDSTHFERTGSDQNYGFIQVSGSGVGFSNFIFGIWRQHNLKRIFAKI